MWVPPRWYWMNYKFGFLLDGSGWIIGVGYSQMVVDGLWVWVPPKWQWMYSLTAAVHTFFSFDLSHLIVYQYKYYRLNPYDLISITCSHTRLVGAGSSQMVVLC